MNRFWRLFAVVGLLVLLVPGLLIGAARVVADSDATVHHITWDGVERSYRLFVPASLDGSEPVPLVVMLHGGFGSARQAERAYGWNDMAEASGFVVAYPDGLHRAWNVGSDCCGRPGEANVDDVGFIVAVIDDIAATVPVDRSRLFATGMSNGAKMAYRLACETSIFAAIAPVAGTQLAECSSPHPTSVLHIHGLNDTLVRYDGEPGSGFARINGPPVPNVIDFWRQVDGCDQPVIATLGDVTDSWSACQDGRAVEMLTIAGMGHTWPGGGNGPGAQLRSIRRGGDSLIATVAIWDFFSDKTLA